MEAPGPPRAPRLLYAWPTRHLGRVSSVNAIFIGSSNELGAFESGATARLLGAIQAVLFGGVSSLLVVGTIALSVPSLRRLERIGEPG